MMSLPTQDGAHAQSPFQRALEQFMQPKAEKSGKKSKMPKFIADLQAAREPYTQDDVHEAMQQLERKHLDRKSTRAVKTVLKPVVRVLTDYAAVVDTMAQADPMPTSLIWGSMRAAISVSTRFLQLYETISDQLKAIKDLLERLTLYEDLFGESEAMQERLQTSYVYVIRFWYRVEKECQRHVAHRMLMAAASFNTSKLDSIITKITTVADQIDKLVTIVEARRDRGAREDAAEERRLAGITRDRDAEWYDQFREDRKAEHLKRVRHWLLAGTEPSSQSNIRHHLEHSERIGRDTCQWLPTHQSFVSWLAAKGQDANVWMKAAQGTGKSVSCAFACQHLSDSNPEASCVYQYYSFDEEYSPMIVYRNLASQLVDHLWRKTEDIPDDLHKLAHKSESCMSPGDAHAMIELLIAKLGSVYIFLDGLDEECVTSDRERDMIKVVENLSSLTLKESLDVHVWYSSQDRVGISSIMANFPTFEMTESANSADIQLCLSRELSRLDPEDFDKGYKTLILNELLAKAKGCFLWAALMLESISEANRLSDIQKIIRDELPEKYEEYYLKRLQKVPTSQRALVAIILSCIVFAKRPLQLEELREATAAADIDDGQRVEKSRKLLKNKILKLCGPLVRVSDMTDDEKTSPVCVLSHSAVRSFLVKHADLFAPDTSQTLDDNRISEETLANVCLKYLWQPAYRLLFAKDGDTFKDSEGADIASQYLLPYATKYWDKHLDDVVAHRGSTGCLDTQSFCYRAKRFIHSPQLVTCIQVQSLFVEGQFNFWYAHGKEWKGPQIKRAFPHWLADECLPTLKQDYTFFIGEWGHVLDQVLCLTGPAAGEVDRCFWPALGPWHFLHNAKSRYESFMVSTDHQPIHEEYLRYYDAVSPLGDRMIVLKLEGSTDNQERLSFQCQFWQLKDGVFEWSESQYLEVEQNSFRLYEYPLTKGSVGRPYPVAFSEDLSCLRIGSEIFTLRDGERYEKFSLDNDASYVEEIASHDGFVAMAHRNLVTRVDIPDISDLGDEKANRPDFAEFLAERHGLSLEGGQDSTEASSISGKSGFSDKIASTQQTAASLVKNSDASEEAKQQPVAAAGRRVSEDEDCLPTIEGIRLENELNEEDPGYTLEASSTASDLISAVTAWSDGSTNATSDLDRDEEWNDWFQRDDVLEDLESYDHAGDSELKIESLKDLEQGFREDDVEEAEDFIKLHYRDRQNDFDGSVEGDFSDDDDTTDEESDSESEDGGAFDELIGGKMESETAKGEAKRIHLKVYDTKSGKDRPIFHYSHDTKSTLCSSPPAFHPSRPLLVWPLGGEEILFANVLDNTYFTRLLSRSTRTSCHVFIRAHFSSDGRHLHFAALEAGPAEVPEARRDGTSGTEVRMNLQVTTHRLSKRKTSRAPPRLVYRSNVSLGRAPRLNTSDLPYDLTWSERELYLTTRDYSVNVARIPLFHASTGPGVGLDAAPGSVTYVQKRVYLPRTALNRTVKYIPPSRQTRGKTQEQNDRAMVLLGSNCTSVAQLKLVPHVQVSPPIGVFLHEAGDLGGWERKLNRDPDEELHEKNGKQRAGRLRHMLETFDLKDDCDIIPYLY